MLRGTFDVGREPEAQDELFGFDDCISAAAAWNIAEAAFTVVSRTLHFSGSSWLLSV